MRSTRTRSTTTPRCSVGSRGERFSDTAGALDVAFGPWAEPQSIGTRHYPDDVVLRGKDGRPYHTGVERDPEAKNAFFKVFWWSAFTKSGHDPDDVPDLAWSLYQHSFYGMLIMSITAENYEEITRDWAWHREMAQKLLYRPVERNPAEFLVLAPNINQSDDPLAQRMGTIPGNPTTRRRLDQELDEIQEQLIARIIELYYEWRSANDRWAGSGWNVVEARQGEAQAPQGGRAVALGLRATPARRPATRVRSVRGRPARAGSGRGVSDQLSVAPIPEPDETTVRMRILGEMLELFGQAAELGCLNKGPTPCDWSPWLFTAMHGAGWEAPRQDSFDKCVEYVPGSFDAIRNLNVPFIDVPPDHPLAHLNCSVVTGQHITAAGLEQMMDTVDLCRENVPKFKEGLEILERIDRVKKIPELVDPATGEVRRPGVDESGGEDMGNKYFGLSYSYSMLWDVANLSDTCSFHADVGGHLDSHASVMRQEIPLIDAAASLDTRDGNIHAHLNIRGKDIFDPIDIDFEDEVGWSFTREATSGRKEVKFGTTIFVGPIPLEINAGVVGEAGLNMGLGLEFDANLDDAAACPTITASGTLEPFVRIDGFVEAGINLFVAKAGVVGSIVIIQASLPFSVLLQMIAGDFQDADTFRLEVGMALDIALSTLGGYVALYGQLGWCPFCVRGELKLVDWQGIVWTDNIFTHTYEVSIADLVSAVRGL